MGRRIDARWYSHHPGDHESEKREGHREEQTLTDQLRVLALILKRTAQVAAQKAAHPAPILDDERLVHAELHLERIHLCLIHGRSRRGQRRDIAGEEVAGRRLHQPENDDRKKKHQERQQEQALDDVSEHRDSWAVTHAVGGATAHENVAQVGNLRYSPFSEQQRRLPRRRRTSPARGRQGAGREALEPIRITQRTSLDHSPAADCGPHVRVIRIGS